MTARQTVTLQVSDPSAEHRGPANPPLNACQAPGRTGVPGVDSHFPGRTKPAVSRGGRGRTAAQLAGWPDGRPTHFQITSSEIANACSQHWKRRLSIHLQASYSNVISRCGRMANIFVPGLRHDRRNLLDTQLEPAATDCVALGQVRRVKTRRAPGRDRTDTGDPFRGPASSFGLRGLGNSTSAQPDYSRPAYEVEKDPLRCIYSILRS